MKAPPKLENKRWQKCRSRACYGKPNVTPIMAIDSHNDDHYELLIDTVNNNHEKPCSNPTELNDKPECSSHVSSSAAETLSGSSRRKCATLSKGITIEEFLETAESSNQLTAIDKLILKNKAALAEDQMKRARTKSKDKPAVTQKKSEKNSKNKVVSSRVANTKHKLTSTNATKSKTNGVPKIKNNPPKVKGSVTKAVVEKPKKSKQEKREARQADTNISQTKRKNTKKTLSEKATKNDEKASTTASRKVLITVRKTKREPKVNCKSFDMKRLKKNNVAYRTRSINKEKLRNGKTRIIREITEELSMERKKKNGRSKECPSENTTPVRNVLKRPIKQEPADDDSGIVRKRKITALETPPLKNNEVPAKISQNSCDQMDFEELPIAVVKQEDVKQEIETEPENSNVVEINVNMNIAPNSPESTGYTLESETIKKEETAVPYGIVLGNCRSISEPQESREQSLIEPEKQDLTLDSGVPVVHDFTNDTSESLNLHLDNTDDDIEEIVIDDDSSTSTEPEPVSLAPALKASVEKEKRASPCKLDDSARDSIFSALGLQSIGKHSQTPKEKETKDKNYTGTLKMVIKTGHGCRRTEMKQTDNGNENGPNENILSFYSKTIPIVKKNGEDQTSLNCSSNGESSSDSSGMLSLFLEDDTEKETKNTNPEVPVLSGVKVKETNLMSNGDATVKETDTKALDKPKGDESLIVPEKSSSFSIHPNRLCSDVCKYCFGKFGSLDTPCHIGQLKNLERQKTILGSEPNLRIDTCLCDACFRYVDRKANRPFSKRKIIRPSLAHSKITCAVQNCTQLASKLYAKRKWRSKICRKFANLSFDLRGAGNSVALGLCHYHYSMLDMYTLCGICKKRLNRNDMYSIRTEVNDINYVLAKDGIPVKLNASTLLCRYCRHCTSLRLNFGEPACMEKNNREYYESFKNEVIRSLRERNSDDEVTHISETHKTETCNTSLPERADTKPEELTNGVHPAPDTNTSTALPKSESTAATTTMTTTTTTNNQTVDIKDIANLLKPLEVEHSGDKNATRIQLKFGNLNIGKLSNLNIGQNNTHTQVMPENKVERVPGEKDLPLIADFSFDNDEVTRGWERCVSTIQFDKSTKKLWQELQKPYGNQSSFIRHLIMLEKYWRSGALTLSGNAEPGAVKYINSVKNRIESLEVSSTPKLPPVPALAPAPLPPSVKKIIEPSVTLLPAPPPLQPAPKPPPPPPLLKLNCASSPFIMRKTTPICTVRPTSEIVKTSRTSLPAPPKLARIPNVLKGRPIAVSTLPSQNLPRVIQVSSSGIQTITGPTKNRTLNYINNGNNLTKTLPSFMTTSYSKSSPSIKVDCRQPMKVDCRQSSMLIAKLPKALTVTQVNEMASKERNERQSSAVATPFLVGEKPSVTVFREMSSK